MVVQQVSTPKLSSVRAVAEQDVMSVAGASEPTTTLTSDASRIRPSRIASLMVIANAPVSQGINSDAL